MFKFQTHLAAGSQEDGLCWSLCKWKITVSNPQKQILLLYRVWSSISWMHCGRCRHEKWVQVRTHLIFEATI